ncbi:hypothetical protein SAICODRAFT_224354 [Saitoella complicata NRRL Y-17804]|nr:uncharacterized protein SAICODRAFT_224354 [Saitoella complicata NRRL Y-17804]ODQ53749.1 hypothetical protein SAICODRAFT_224354 [Saitoella complicata NRRL Y-17804]
MSLGYLTSKMSKLSTVDFFANYNGHLLSHLSTLHTHLRSQNPTRPIVFFAGDSSLDNKHWLFTKGKSDPAAYQDERCAGRAPEAYEGVLEPARCIKDVAWHLNNEINPDAVVLNAAIEATTLSARSKFLLAQDEFIRDNITPNDYLVVSVGANDIVLAPSMSTITHMATMLLSPTALINTGHAPGMGYFVHMFRDEVAAYVNKLVSKTKPKAVVVCMIYNPGPPISSGGWADHSLQKLGYDSTPAKLQAAIGKVYELGTKEIKIEGVKVVPCLLADALDGTDERDYVQRVEPSVEGGKKMAELLGRVVKEEMTR